MKKKPKYAEIREREVTKLRRIKVLYFKEMDERYKLLNIPTLEQQALCLTYLVNIKLKLKLKIENIPSEIPLLSIKTTVMTD